MKYHNRQMSQGEPDSLTPRVNDRPTTGLRRELKFDTPGELEPSNEENMTLVPLL